MNFVTFTEQILNGFNFINFLNLVPRLNPPQSVLRWNNGPLNHSSFGFFTSPIILHNLNQPRENIEFLIAPVNFWILPRWILILSVLYYSALDVRQRLVWVAAVCGNFSPYYLFLLTFYGELGTGYCLVKDLLIKTVLRLIRD